MPDSLIFYILRCIINGHFAFMNSTFGGTNHFFTAIFFSSILVYVSLLALPLPLLLLICIECAGCIILKFIFISDLSIKIDPFVVKLDAFSFCMCELLNEYEPSIRLNEQIDVIGFDKILFYKFMMKKTICNEAEKKKLFYACKWRLANCFEAKIKSKTDNNRA